LIEGLGKTLVLTRTLETLVDAAGEECFTEEHVKPQTMSRTPATV
jgi:hypothetical protein